MPAAFLSSVEFPLMEISVVPTDGGATPGSPARYGELVGLSLTGTTTVYGDGKATIHLGPARVSVSVKGVDGSGNSAVAVGDKLYYVDADTPKISKKATGRIFGRALAAITSGSTATIEVLMQNF